MSTIESKGRHNVPQRRLQFEAPENNTNKEEPAAPSFELDKRFDFPTV